MVGLLDERVITELRLRDYGYKVFVAEPFIWCPFEDGTSYAQFQDPERTAADMRANGFADADIEGQFAYEDFFDRMRIALRKGPRDAWVGEAPERAELEELLGHDPEMIEALYETPISEVIDRHVEDERLKRALYGQGIIGAWAGPHDPGTAFVKLMHFLGELEGVPMAWGYVEGGMGAISFAIAEAARDLGAVLAAGVPVAEILPGEGVRLEGGELIRAEVVISNADPKATLALLGDSAPDAFRDRVDDWRVTSPVLKVNCALSRLPDWSAVPGEVWPNQAPVTIGQPMDDAQRAFEACTRGEVDPAFAELYFHSAYDPSVAPAGKHTLSAFVQYGPYDAGRGHLGQPAGRDRPEGPRDDRRVLRHRGLRRRGPGPGPARTSRRRSASPRATSSTASARRTRCGPTASPPAPPWTGSTSAAPPPTPPAACAASTAATPPTRCWRTWTAEAEKYSTIRA